MKTLGQICYEAFATQRFWRFQGQIMEEWGKLSDTSKLVWEYVAAQVETEVLQRKAINESLEPNGN